MMRVSRLYVSTLILWISFLKAHRQGILVHAMHVHALNGNGCFVLLIKLHVSRLTYMYSIQMHYRSTVYISYKKYRAFYH